MKKIVGVLMVVICTFALLLNLSKVDEDKEWSFRHYVNYVTRNFDPFPTVELTFTYDNTLSGWEMAGEFISYIGQLISYPFKVIGVVCHNAMVIFDGFFAVAMGDITLPGGYIGESGGGDSSGDFGGGGFGGGGGGIR